MSRKKPNILLCTRNQHRADVLGSAGDEVAPTPHIDRLRRGIALQLLPDREPGVCRPARASVSTGRYPTDHGILGNLHVECSHDWDTVPRAIQAAGHDAASVGTTHCSSWPIGPNGVVDTPPPDEWIGAFGFDHVVEESARSEIRQTLRSDTGPHRVRKPTLHPPSHRGRIAGDRGAVPRSRRAR